MGNVMLAGKLCNSSQGNAIAAVFGKSVFTVKVIIFSIVVIAKNNELKFHYLVAYGLRLTKKIENRSRAYQRCVLRLHGLA